MILDDIIEHKKSELIQSINLKPLREIEEEIKEISQPKDFYNLATNHKGLKIISEVKKASPSKGLICKDFDPVRIAKSYRDNGAFAISVLTDKKFFDGQLGYLSGIRKEVDIPLLRKDFTIDPYQIYEARLYGADIILLIASVLEMSQITEYLDVTHSLGMNAIVEVHNKNELEKAVGAGSRIVGINNRDLKTFEVSLSTTEDLIELIPDHIHVISESGISDPNDIRNLIRLGISTFLIGETFMSSTDPGSKLGAFIKSVEEEI
ncbi:MAG: indole-3-glycerol phosphate synthase TrpC [Thermodesulfobacteriota bacterium]